MRTFELNIFIDCPRDKVYDHLSEPINMIGLLPSLTTIDVLKEKRGEDGIIVRPFHTVETFRLAGLARIRSRTYSVIRLAKPKEELEIHVHRRPGVDIVFNYQVRESNRDRTHITQTVRFVNLPRLLESFVANQANHSQRALLSNLKVRLEGK